MAYLILRGNSVWLLSRLQRLSPQLSFHHKHAPFWRVGKQTSPLFNVASKVKHQLKKLWKFADGSKADCGKREAMNGRSIHQSARARIQKTKDWLTFKAQVAH
jgi:hypothetical protein